MEWNGEKEQASPFSLASRASLVVGKETLAGKVG